MKAAHVLHTHATLTREFESAIATTGAALRDIPTARREIQTRAEALTADTARSRATGVALNGGAALESRRAQLALDALGLQDRTNAAAGAAFTAVSGLAMRALAMLAQAAHALKDFENRKAERDELAAAAAAEREGERRRAAERLAERDRLQAAAVAAGTHTWEDFKL